MTQNEALNILKMGKNVFITGPAGSGKTFVINSYIEYLKKHAVDVAVTASTGIASTHIGGQTIHSWSGIGIRDYLTEYDLDDLRQRQYLYKRFEKTKVLVIDEVSMLHSFRLDLIELVCRHMKGSDEPFGGMQVILCGDFFQLPPVTRVKETQISFDDTESMNSDFAYNAESFRRAGFVVCYLEEQYRQKDKQFLSVLNNIRKNNVTKETLDLLKSRLNIDTEQDGVFTRLYTHNIDVDSINKKHLDLLKTQSKKYKMQSVGSPNLTDILKKSCLSPEELELRVNSKVMFTKNHPERLYVNGTLGTVVGFNSFGEPIVETKNGMKIDVVSQSWKIEEDGKVKAEVSQIPLRLAWAITVHKSQGMSLDSMEVDLSKSFVKGMGYVALSRVRTLDGMKLLGLNDTALQVDPEVLKMDKKFMELSQKAVNDLSNIKKTDLEKAHSEWLKMIEPEEKVKIKKKEKLLKKSTSEITLDMLLSEKSLKDMADERGLKEETIISHIEDLQTEGKCPDIDYLKREFKRSELDDILDAFSELDTKTLSPVYNYLLRKKKKITYTKIRLARLFL